MMERRYTVRVRRIIYSLAWLSALAIALSAGWKANSIGPLPPLF